MRFWPFGKRGAATLVSETVPLYFYNSLGKALQVFTPLEKDHVVRMYNCGPTLYGPQHIGNLSMFVFADVLRRTLEYNGYRVKQVINFTDFGHLSSDSDEGDDKMTIGLKREGLAPTMQNMRALADKYAALFLEDLERLHIDTRRIKFPYASDYVAAQIAMIHSLEEKGYAYRGDDGVYFDTTRYPHYGELGGLHSADSEARVAGRSSKRHPTDFVLWKSSDSLGWDSPWGMGFPGWHIECSAMIRALLGERIDIHTGGIEHIPIHHNNEIAQSESATGKRPFARFWMHRAHLQIDGGKIAKSAGSVLYLSPDISEKYHPIAFRYLLLTAHYRASQNFSWQALDAAQVAYLKLRSIVDAAPAEGSIIEAYRTRIHERINDDLDTAGALAIIWELVKDGSLSPADIRATVLDADRVFGLGLAHEDERAATMQVSLFGEEVALTDLSPEIADLVARRQAARAEKKWEDADTLRDEIALLGYTLEDSSTGLKIFKRS